MPTTVEVLFTPAEIAVLARRDLSQATCVVFDVLRATSTFVSALANGATSILPVMEIADALAAKTADPQVLLAGERHGRRITAHDSGGIDFDLGNSPREFIREVVSDRRIVSTTTNGTRALRACAKARQVLAGAFLNLSATAAHLCHTSPRQIVIICAGTGELLALEDVLAAGALCVALTSHGLKLEAGDSAQVARGIFLQSQSNLAAIIAGSQNGRRLLSIPELRDDVQYCAQRDILKTIAAMNAEGRLVTA